MRRGQPSSVKWLTLPTSPRLQLWGKLVRLFVGGQPQTRIEHAQCLVSVSCFFQLHMLRWNGKRLCKCKDAESAKPSVRVLYKSGLESCQGKTTTSSHPALLFLNLSQKGILPVMCLRMHASEPSYESNTLMCLCRCCLQT